MSEITVLSLGAGMQSSCLLLMAQKGLVPRPVEAVFADTGWEPAAVYEHLAWLREQTDIPIVTVQKGNLRDDALASKTAAWMPLYILGRDGSEGMLRRQCTQVYKIGPIRRRVRVLMKEHGATHVRMQMGISLDEAVERMKLSDVKYITNVYPLVDHLMSRDQCESWLEREYSITVTHPAEEVPKSACQGCPYLNDRRWRELRDNRPDEWADVVAFDAAIRRMNPDYGDAFLHRQRVPLSEVDLSTPQDRGQLSFLDECEGMCGV
jgi:hypothetical protein